MKPKSRHNDIVVQKTNGETLIYDLKTNKAFLLNETSAFVWNNCDGKNDISTIAKLLSAKLKQPANEDFVWLALDGLQKDNLMVEAEDVRQRLQNLNRREVVKRIGMGTMIMLPLVTAITAPKAINAASGGSTLAANGEACTTNNQCQSTCCTTFICKANNKPDGSSCTSECECAIGLCSFGMCGLP